MGQVYQATDTKLNRQVALKILPEAFATDPDRLALRRVAGVAMHLMTVQRIAEALPTGQTVGEER